MRVNWHSQLKMDTRTICNTYQNRALKNGLGCFNHNLVTSVAFLLCVRHVQFKECEQSVVEKPRNTHCDRCGGIVKTDTVMFGEPIPVDALELCHQESSRADCVILVGTTAVVSPAADFAFAVGQRGHPMIEVNLDPTVIEASLCVKIN